MYLKSFSMQSTSDPSDIPSDISAHRDSIDAGLNDSCTGSRNLVNELFLAKKGNV